MPLDDSTSGQFTSGPRSPGTRLLDVIELDGVYLARYYALRDATAAWLASQGEHDFLKLTPDWPVREYFNRDDKIARGILAANGSHLQAVALMHWENAACSSTLFDGGGHDLHERYPTIAIVSSVLRSRDAGKEDISAVLNQLEAEAALAGAHALGCITDSLNRRALGVFERHGFRKKGGMTGSRPSPANGGQK